MPITIAQLNQLAEHFNFNITEARQLIGLPIPKTPPTSTRETKPSKSTAKSSKTKGVTGYRLYCADCKSRVQASLLSEKGVKKLGRGELLSELSKRWNLLPESTREHWNRQAASA
tara:strand:- start:98 stop:442 length:345 start_codon:yes stop_codon:yes gene_type:complete